MERIEDKNFELLLIEKRHKELIDVLKKILSNLLEVKKDDTVNILNELLSSSNQLPSAVKAIADVIITKLEQMEKKPIINKWKFQVHRDSNGYIDTIMAEGK